MAMSAEVSTRDLTDGFRACCADSRCSPRATSASERDEEGAVGEPGDEERSVAAVAFGGQLLLQHVEEHGTGDDGLEGHWISVGEAM